MAKKMCAVTMNSHEISKVLYTNLLRKPGCKPEIPQLGAAPQGTDTHHPDAG
jgi:hypothetical protein